MTQPPKHLELTKVDIDFPTPNGPFKALQDVNLTINKGEFVSLIGHSGCGKSTVLNIVAGLYQATKEVAACLMVKRSMHRALNVQWFSRTTPYYLG